MFVSILIICLIFSYLLLFMVIITISFGGFCKAHCKLVLKIFLLLLLTGTIPHTVPFFFLLPTGPWSGSIRARWMKERTAPVSGWSLFCSLLLLLWFLFVLSSCTHTLCWRASNNSPSCPARSACTDTVVHAKNPSADFIPSDWLDVQTVDSRHTVCRSRGGRESRLPKELFGGNRLSECGTYCLEM